MRANHKGYDIPTQNIDVEMATKEQNKGEGMIPARASTVYTINSPAYLL